MKKTFPLHASDRADARVIEAIKYDIRKYVKRERKKTVPAEFDLWEFACKVGADPTAAFEKPLRELSAGIDAVAASGADAVYVEVVSVPAKRTFPASSTPTSLGSPTVPPAAESPTEIGIVSPA